MDDWARAARLSFIDGYVAASGIDLDAQRPLLDALELDKAVYEAIYEVRNRPDWITIPLAGDPSARLVATQCPTGTAETKSGRIHSDPTALSYRARGGT